MNIWNVDWLNSNSQRNYPLSDTADGKDKTGSFELPNDFIVDMVMSIPTALNAQPGEFHLMTVASFTGGAVLTFGCNEVAIAAVSIPASTHAPYASYPLVGQGDGYDVRGSVTIGKFDTLQSLPGGVFSFTLDSGRLVASVVRPAIRGVSSIALKTGTNVGTPLTGDVVLAAGRNFKLSQSGKEIRMDCMAEASTLQSDCGCENPALLQPPIRSIGNVFPDEDGKITLLGDPCLQILEGLNAIGLNDLCSKPCCGCDELGVIQSDIALLFQQLGAATLQLTRLEGALTNTTDNLLAAKLGTNPSCEPSS